MQIVFQVGGIHIKKPKSIPEGDLKAFLDAATEGVVYVSFGSGVRPSAMADDKKRVFTETFQQLQVFKIPQISFSYYLLKIGQIV